MADRIDYSLTMLPPINGDDRYEICLTNLTKAECGQVAGLMLAMQMARTATPLKRKP